MPIKLAYDNGIDTLTKEQVAEFEEWLSSVPNEPTANGRPAWANDPDFGEMDMDEIGSFGPGLVTRRA